MWRFTVVLAMMIGLPGAASAQQDQSGLRRVHLMTGAGTIPRNPANRLEYLRYATTGYVDFDTLAPQLMPAATRSWLLEARVDW